MRCPEASLTVWSTLESDGPSLWWTVIRTRTISSVISLWSHKSFGRFWACHPRKICHRSWSWVMKLLKHQTLINLFPLQENRKAIVSRQAGSVPCISGWRGPYALFLHYPSARKIHRGTSEPQNNWFLISREQNFTPRLRSRLKHWCFGFILSSVIEVIEHSLALSAFNQVPYLIKQFIWNSTSL